MSRSRKIIHPSVATMLACIGELGGEDDEGRKLDRRKVLLQRRNRLPRRRWRMLMHLPPKAFRREAVSYWPERSCCKATRRKLAPISTKRWHWQKASRTKQKKEKYALAELAIEEQRRSDAREMLRRRQVDQKHSKNVDAELECLMLQAELELLDKQNDAALSTALQARSVARRDERFDLKMSAAEVLAKAAAASRKWTHADQVINSCLQRALESGCVACELRARLSECTLKADRDAPDASLCFKNLQKAAESKGFGRIAKNSALGGARQGARAQ